MSIVGLIPLSGMRKRGLINGKPVLSLLCPALPRMLKPSAATIFELTCQCPQPPRQTASCLMQRFREVALEPDKQRGQNSLIDLNLLG